MIPQLGSLTLSSPQPPPHITSLANAVIDRLRGRILVTTYADVAASFSSQTGTVATLGDLERNVVVLPREYSSCANVAIVVATGKSGAGGLSRKLQAIHNYALSHHRELLSALVVTDVWQVKAHLPDLLAVTASGVQVRAFLGGEAIQGLAEIPLNLAVPLVPHAIG